jgi:hypothetical protein
METVVDLEQIELDPTTQPRVSIDMEIVSEYAEEIKAGADFPPIQVVWDKQAKKYWLWDGFHRVMAAKQIGQLWLMAHVVPGTREEAQWWAYSANAAHGLRRTNADKRRAVEGALLHPSGVDKTNRQVARHCGVSHFLVNQVRKELEASGRIFQMGTRAVQRGDQVYEMDVSNIGRQVIREPSIELSEPPAVQEQILPPSSGSQMPRAALHPQIEADGDKHLNRGNGDSAPDEHVTSCSLEEGGTDEGYVTFGGAGGTYTAPEIVEAAQICLGEIDLDPCAGRHSGAEIPADESLGPDVDGLAHEWHGRIGLNPPYGHMIRYWISKLCAEHDASRTTAAIAIVPTRTGERWWKEIADRAAAVCFVDDGFRDAGNGRPAVQSLAVLYLGDDPSGFYAAFASLGDVWARVDLPVEAVG